MIKTGQLSLSCLLLYCPLSLKPLSRSHLVVRCNGLFKWFSILLANLWLSIFLIMQHSLPHFIQYLCARCQKVHKGTAWESKLVLQVATCFLQWQKTFPTKVLIFNASKVLFFMLYYYILSRRKDLRSINFVRKIVSDNFNSLDFSLLAVLLLNNTKSS